MRGSDAHGGSMTLSTGWPFCLVPKSKHSLLARNSGKKKNSGINSFTSVADSLEVRRHVVCNE